MKTKLFTKNISLGLLVAFVLALGVQGIAEALTLTATSSISQSARQGSTFEMSFRVGLTGNKVQNHPTEVSTRRINAGNHDSNVYIDAQGYQVSYIGTTSRSYRNTTETPAGTLAVDPRPTYSTDSGGTATPSGTPNSDPSFLVDTSGNVYDQNGKAVYVRTGSGTRASGGDAASPWRYTRAKANPTTAVANVSALHDYNDEAIEFWINRTGTPDGVTAAGTLKLKNTSYVLPGRDSDESSSTTTDVSTQSLQERKSIGLPSTINLVYEGATVGTHTIKVWDATPIVDFPLDELPSANRPRASIEFKIYVTPATTTIGSANITAPSERIPVQDAVVPVSANLTFTPTEGNQRIRYEVVKGSGTLYVGTLEREYTTPSSLLSVHQSSNVYLKTNDTSNEVHVWFAGENRTTPRVAIVFEYRGKPLPATRINPTPAPAPPTPPAPPTANTITVSRTSISGAPGTTQSLTVSAGAAAVRLQGDAAFTAAGGTISGTGATRSITLPNSPGSTYILTASASNYADREISVTVTQPQALGTLTLTTVDTRSGSQQTLRVTAQRGGSPPSSALTVTLTGVTNRTTVTIQAGQSSTAFVATLASASTAQTVTADAEGYNRTTITIPAPGQQQTTGQQTTTGQQQPAQQTARGTPDEVQIRSEAFPSGRANTQLAQPLVVRVLDATGNGVRNVRVIFEVTSGQGRLSRRGNGRATRAQTDVSGNASARYTPISEESTVRATAAGVSQTVTFTISATGAGTTTPTPTQTPTPGPPKAIDPVVRIAAASRPPMVWVDRGAIYAFVGAKPQRFVPSVSNAQNITVAGDKVYWTARTSANAGTIHSANMDGTGVTQLATRPSVPMGIAVDTTRKKLFWTTRAGTIERANLDGTGIETVRSNLSDIQDIAIAGNGNPYWTQGNGSVRFVNISGQTPIWTIASGATAVGSLTLADGKVYWTARTGTTGGTINRANLNGSAKAVLATIQAVPIGVAVDTARSHIYWTNTGGRLQRRNLAGNGTGTIENVAEGLGSPADMVISNSIMEPAAPTPPTTPTTASKSKYDVNGDGKVDNVDASLVAGAMNTSNAKYDVNGDGTVNFLDLLLVFDNRDKGAASAPTIVGMKLSVVQVDTLKEQIDLLIATGDRSPTAIKTLIYLQQLIALARPEKTQLLANYPNPFNPETWIPYELAEATQVKITIYNAQGVVIRTLSLGQQSAGYYTDRERAAYWDGRNALGEQVASGVYFYQLETDEMSSLRKMVILK